MHLKCEILSFNFLFIEQYYDSTLAREILLKKYTAQTGHI